MHRSLRTVLIGLISLIGLIACSGAGTAGAPAAPGGASPDPGLSVVVDVDQGAVTLDDCVWFSLQLVGPAIDQAVASWPAAGTVRTRSQITAASAGLAHPMFLQSQPVRFQPDTAGIARIGPFTLRIGDLELRSNTVDLVVAPAPAGGESVRLIPHETRARVGEPFVLTVIAYSGTSLFDRPDWSSPRLQDELVAKAERLSLSVGSNSHGCLARYAYKTVITYAVTPSAPGTLTLGAESFDTLPAGAVVQEVAIEVAE